MSNMFFHYQERAVRANGTAHATLTDTIMTMQELLDHYDQLQIEGLLNSVGQWQDNGVVYLNRNGIRVRESYEGYTAAEHKLEIRITRVVSEAHLEDYKKETAGPKTFIVYNGDRYDQKAAINADCCSLVKVDMDNEHAVSVFHEMRTAIEQEVSANIIIEDLKY